MPATPPIPTTPGYSPLGNQGSKPGRASTVGFIGGVALLWTVWDLLLLNWSNKIIDIFKSLGGELPLPTRQLILLSGLLLHRSALSVLLHVFIFGLLIIFYRQMPGSPARRDYTLTIMLGFCVLIGLSFFTLIYLPAFYIPKLIK